MPPARNTRTHPVHVPGTDEEWTAVKIAAALQQQSVTKFAAEAILKEARKILQRKAPQLIPESWK